MKSAAMLSACTEQLQLIERLCLSGSGVLRRDCASTQGRRHDNIAHVARVQVHTACLKGADQMTHLPVIAADQSMRCTVSITSM